MMHYCCAKTKYISNPAGRIALRILVLPAPVIGTHVIDVFLRLPAQQFARLVGQRVATGDVTKEAWHDVVRHGRWQPRRHVQAFAATHGNLGDEGHPVVRNTGRVFAKQAARMGTDWVEIAQHADLHWVSVCTRSCQDLLNHQLGVAIRVGHGPARRFQYSPINT